MIEILAKKLFLFVIIYMLVNIIQCWLMVLVNQIKWVLMMQLHQVNQMKWLLTMLLPLVVRIKCWLMKIVIVSYFELNEICTKLSDVGFQNLMRRQRHLLSQKCQKQYLIPNALNTYIHSRCKKKIALEHSFIAKFVLSTRISCKCIQVTEKKHQSQMKVAHDTEKTVLKNIFPPCIMQNAKKQNKWPIVIHWARIKAWSIYISAKPTRNLQTI